MDGVDISVLVQMNNVESVEILNTSGAVLLGSRGYGGAVVITTKKGKLSDKALKVSKNIDTFIPLGYQNPDEFYSPKYETKQEKENTKPDLRSTIYWKPDVIVAENGETELSFYTADAESAYYIVIEGVTFEGRLIYNVEQINKVE